MAPPHSTVIPEVMVGVFVIHTQGEFGFLSSHKLSFGINTSLNWSQLRSVAAFLVLQETHVSKHNVIYFDKITNVCNHSRKFMKVTDTICPSNL